MTVAHSDEPSEFKETDPELRPTEPNEALLPVFGAAATPCEAPPLAEIIDSFKVVGLLIGP